jgi:hypothetical protein
MDQTASTSSALLTGASGESAGVAVGSGGGASFASVSGVILKI